MDIAPCVKCGSNLAELGNFTYSGVTNNHPGQRDEQCKCKSCGEIFTLQYNFFDDTGHIQTYVFNGDVNDLTYDWQDQLTSEQKTEIGNHLKVCKTCNDRLAEETLSDAWLAALLHNEKK